MGINNQEQAKHPKNIDGNEAVFHRAGIGGGAGISKPKEMRGVVIRGSDPDATRDPEGRGRALGSYQADLVGHHSHNSNAAKVSTRRSNDGAHLRAGWEVANIHNTGSGIGSETRMKNISVKFWIRLE